MKKLFFTAIAALTLGMASYAADGNKVSYRTLNTFEKEFSGATDVSWSVTPVYTKAKFKIADEQVEAFFDGNGEVIGLSRKVDLKKLPLSAIQKIQKNYSKHEILETIEFTQNSEPRYYVSLVKDGKKQILEVTAQRSISAFHANMQ